MLILALDKSNQKPNLFIYLFTNKLDNLSLYFNDIYYSYSCIFTFFDSTTLTPHPKRFHQRSLKWTIYLK